MNIHGTPSRAGREPTEDVKRRIMAACEEVGLVVATAHFHKLPDHSIRLIHVEASLPDWPHQGHSMLTIMAPVTLAGDWPEFVDIRCTGSDSAEDPMGIHGPWMTGRDRVPFTELVQELLETLEERKHVVANYSAGNPGPFQFTRSLWKRAF